MRRDLPEEGGQHRRRCPAACPQGSKNAGDELITRELESWSIRAAGDDFYIELTDAIRDRGSRNGAR